MHRLVKPLLVVLAVPLACTLIALSGRTEWDSRWQAGLRREFLLRRQPVSETFIARYSLATLCSDDRTAATIRPCRTYRLFTSVAATSAGAAGLGLLLLVGLAAAGKACQERRERLARLFTPGLRLAIAGIVVLALLHAVLGIGGLYLLGQVIERWPSFIVFGLVVAGLLVALSVAQVAMAVARRPPLSLVGRIAAPASHPRLVAAISTLASSLGVRMPDRLVLGLAPGCFVVDGHVSTLDGAAQGRTLYLSLPLARILSVEELRAILAHELAHFRQPDEDLTVRFYPAYAAAGRALEVLRRKARGWRAVAVAPALWLLAFFVEGFAPAARSAAREREQVADAAAVSIAGREAAATALVKTHAFSPAWDAVREAMDAAVAEGTQYTSASALFVQVVNDNAGPVRLVGLGRLALWHPVDALPALGDRLAALGVNLPGVAAAALVTRPEVPAISLIENPEGLERDLSEVEHRLLALERARLVEAGFAPAAS